MTPIADFLEKSRLIIDTVEAQTDQIQKAAEWFSASILAGVAVGWRQEAALQERNLHGRKVVVHDELPVVDLRWRPLVAELNALELHGVGVEPPNGGQAAHHGGRLDPGYGDQPLLQLAVERHVLGGSGSLRANRSDVRVDSRLMRIATRHKRRSRR